MTEERKKTSKKIDRLQQRAKLEAELRYHDDKTKILTHKMSQEKWNARTHRLRTRGAMLESVLTKPLLLTDDDVLELLQFAFSQSGTREKETELTQKQKKIIIGKTGTTLP